MNKFFEINDSDAYTTKNISRVFLAIACCFGIDVWVGLLSLVMIEPITTAIDKIMEDKKS